MAKAAIHQDDSPSWDTGFQQKGSNRIGRRLQQSSTCRHLLMSTEFKFCGMVRYLAKFMPNLAGDLEPIRALTKKESMWNWSRECDEALNAVMRKVTNTQVLAYFDLEKELLLRVDSSKDGLGAAILQTGRPIELASRAFTQAEQKWAQTGRRHCHWCLPWAWSFGPVCIRAEGAYPEWPQTTGYLPSWRNRSAKHPAVSRHWWWGCTDTTRLTFQYVQSSQLSIADTLSRAFLPQWSWDRCSYDGDELRC